eukprot:GFKZ01008756.1.p1 GENE.GFKZ01008756.1~~GFKZ01008756.1.p1  ORF type:complete len:102 (-),score=3.63 GFKZ01008756.1:519-824(-)
MAIVYSVYFQGVASPWNFLNKTCNAVEGCHSTLGTLSQRPTSKLYKTSFSPFPRPLPRSFDENAKGKRSATVVRDIFPLGRTQYTSKFPNSDITCRHAPHG